MQKIIPYLWFDKGGQEAADFYCSIFKNSKVGLKTYYGDAGKEIHGQEAGSVQTVEFEIEGYKFVILNAGPYFKLNPSISFMLNYDPSKDKDAKSNLDEAWEKLSEGGEVLMPIDKYPFSERYGWIQDKYGVSWQLILSDPSGEERPFVVTSLLFVNDVYGKAEEAMNFYLTVFKNSKKGSVNYYGKGQEPEKEDAVMYADFMLENQWFAAMDSNQDHKFNFSEAISFLVNCENQEEIDELWGKLSAVPESEQCGWLKDKYGVSWQIVPASMEDFLRRADPETANKVMDVVLKMKKLDMAEIEKAYKRE